MKLPVLSTARTTGKRFWISASSLNRPVLMSLGAILIMTALLVVVGATRVNTRVGKAEPSSRKQHRGMARLNGNTSPPRTPLLALPLAGSAQVESGKDKGRGDEKGDGGKIRTFYLAAEEAEWNFAPSGLNQLTGRPFGDLENTYVQNGPSRIGSTYTKAQYFEYTNASFTERKPADPRWRHLGILGPAIHAEVGDTIRVIFKNKTSIPASVHPHGVLYAKDGSEGAPYNDGTAPKLGDAVPPGGSFTYVWEVPERAGPGPMDGSSACWMYHSHVDEVGDTNAGLIGPLIITARGKARPDGSPRDVDREFISMYKVFNENVSPYLSENLKKVTGDPGSINPDEEFEESNLMHSINGYVYGNLDVNDLTMRKGERVRWYMLSVGSEPDSHTPHWHGNTGLYMGMRMDMIELLPGSMKVFDMTPDDVGIWYYHCHVDDHILAGMQTRYQVIP